MPLPIGVFGDFLSHHILMKEVACMELELKQENLVVSMPLCSQIYDRLIYCV